MEDVVKETPLGRIPAAPASPESRRGRSPSGLDRVYRGRRVLVTGHTGFKGGWLATWLKLLGADVTGFALAPEAGRPNFFERARVAEGMTSILGDVREPAAVARAFDAARPELVFHLAAQALVRRSYREPVETFLTNVIGTAHVLEAARRSHATRAVVVVTSDKCYRPRADGRPHREDDALGGEDPYSASKAAAEQVVASYRDSFFLANEVGIASARAGNVVGGGDWAQDRLVPDCVRALSSDKDIPLRNPGSVRPWQHVLEPLSGYLWLAGRLLEEPARFSSAWNFGPSENGAITVSALARLVVREWGAEDRRIVVERDAAAPPERAALRLDASKAAERLGWRSICSAEEAVRETVAWHKATASPETDGRAVTEGQIRAYVERARAAGLSWAASRPPARRKARA